jgi:hypothetical protein
VLLAGLLAAALGCAHRQAPLAEEPGCARLPIERGESRQWRSLPPGELSGALLGEVVKSPGDTAISQALVVVVAGRDSFRVTTGVDGRFRFALAGDTVVRVDIRRVGYDRVLVPALRVRADSLLRVPMQMAPHDGPCSGFAVPVRRR